MRASSIRMWVAIDWVIFDRGEQHSPIFPTMLQGTSGSAYLQHSSIGVSGATSGITPITKLFTHNSEVIPLLPMTMAARGVLMGSQSHPLLHTSGAAHLKPQRTSVLRCPLRAHGCRL